MYTKPTLSAQKISSLLHYSHLIEYLSRADVAQKWTNEYTQYNLIAHKIDSGEILFYRMPEDLSDRFSIDREIRRVISNSLTHNNIKRYLRLELTYIENIPRDLSKENIESLKEEFMNLMRNFINKTESMAVKKGETTFLYVVHVDQPHPHIHRVYCEKHRNPNLKLKTLPDIVE